MDPEPHPATAEILRLFAERGNSRYGGEAVSQLDHALQAAFFATQAGATPALVAAALLHDIGHLLHDLPDDAPDEDIDDRHEVSGQRWLARWFGPEVVEPVRLHVDAKRYLCAVDAQYDRQLSEPSRTSLRLQGGAMNAAEVAKFEKLAHAQQAADLRRWDDAAKVPDLKVPDLASYVATLEAALTAPRGAAL